MARNRIIEGTPMRTQMPELGQSWDTLQARLHQLSVEDADWRANRLGVFVFDPGPEVLQVAQDAYGIFISENGLGATSAFPSLEQMENDVVSMGLNLLNAPESACGNMTSGGTESIFLAVKTCREQARAQGKDTRDAEILMPRSAHLAFDKAAHYLDLKVVRIPVRSDFLADISAIQNAITNRTLMLIGSAPCFPYGMIDPLPELNDLALSNNIWLHVDACVGGYFAPFARMNGANLTTFDFELDGVRSISADLHKYGYSAKGASTLFHRTEEQRKHQLFSSSDWACGEFGTPTLAGTRPGGAIASAWAVMNFLGTQGYRKKTETVIRTRLRLQHGIESIDGMEILGDPQLGLLIYRSVDVDTRAIHHEMMQRGWFSPLLCEPDAIHLMLSPGHQNVVDEYLQDLKISIETVHLNPNADRQSVSRYN